MNQRKWIGTLLLAVSMAAMTVPAAAAPPSASPFAAPSMLPYQAPDFTRIKDSDFLPAFDQAMTEQKAEIARIADSPAPPTFGNTLIAMERSGVMLRRVQSVFGVLSQTDSTPEREAIQKAVAPKLAAHSDAIYLNPKLFARVKSVYDRRDQLHLTPEQLQLAKVIYQRFVRAGAQLSLDDQAKLRAINTQLSTLQTAFGQKLLAATKAGGLVVDNPAGTDRMILHVEVCGIDPQLAATIVASIRDVTKLRGEVMFREVDELPNDGKVIDDLRKLE